jgi:hypothetical protein
MKKLNPIQCGEYKSKKKKINKKKREVFIEKVRNGLKCILSEFQRKVTK